MTGPDAVRAAATRDVARPPTARAVPGPRGIAVVPLLCLLAIGCATTGAAHPPGTGVVHVPVVASSIRSVHGIQLRLQGDAVVRDGWLYVVVPTGSVRTYQGTAEAWDLMLRAALATCSDSGRGRWRVASESPPARIAPLVGLTRNDDMLDTTTRVFGDTLRLDLGVPRGTDLTRAWVAFELAWPIESVLATYTLHTGATLAASGRQQDARRTAETLCRGAAAPSPPPPPPPATSHARHP